MTIKADIIYVGHFRYPDLDVAGGRVRGICLALRDAGYTVAAAGIEDRAQPEDLQPDGEACHEGIYYYPAKHMGSSKLGRLRRGIYHYITGSASIDRLFKLVSDRTRAIVVYNGSAMLLWRLLKLSSKFHIKLIADCTEWYNPNDILFGPFGPFHLDSELRMQWLHPKMGNIIAISSFLERYYTARGCRVVRVPPLVDLQGVRWKPLPLAPRGDDELHLLYAGTPTRKDLLANALLGVVQLRAENYPIKVHLVGSSREKMQEWMIDGSHIAEKLGDTVVFHGRVPRSRAIELVQAADFTMLLRPDQRYAHAGFPTKLVESLSGGTPIITNLTSDIGDFVHDGHEGILVKDHSPEAFAEGVRRIFRMPRSKWHEMRLDARKQAAASFDYRNYIDDLKEFIESPGIKADASLRMSQAPLSSITAIHCAKTLRELLRASPLRSRIRHEIRPIIGKFLAKRVQIPLDREWIFFPCYHCVMDDERKEFDLQLKYLSSLGQFLSLDDAIDALRNPKGVGGRYFCFTFDDGFKNNFENALPVLLDNRATATFYIPTDYIGLDFIRDRKKVNYFFSRSRTYTLPFEFLSWDDCRKLLEAGMTIGSHTCSHHALKGLSDELVKHELLDSKNIIEERLGIECHHFCCPWGAPNVHFDPEIHPRLASQFGYRSFASTQYGYNDSRGEFPYLQRRSLGASDSPAILRYALAQCDRSYNWNDER